jgi:hypothetical protein
MLIFYKGINRMLGITCKEDQIIVSNDAQYKTIKCAKLTSNNGLSTQLAPVA